MVDINPQPIPHLKVPASNHTVRVRAIDTTSRLVCDATAFVQPNIPGHEKLNLKTMCFLLEHTGPAGTEHVLFDCGARKDYWNASPQSRRMIGGHVPGLEVDFGVDEILTAKGFDLSDLKAIVWSHWHWDHIGNGSKFPASVDIVVGPGFTANFVPGYPANPKSFVLASDLEGHRIHEPEFDLTIAGFPAHDYFGDGSFYLLDVPGHTIGHICGFARTTPDTFVFLGGDCCHYAGVFRPNRYQPLPAHLPEDQMDAYLPSPCPCSVFTQHHRLIKEENGKILSRTNPFYNVSRQPGTAYTDGDLAQQSIDRLQPLDAHPGVFICLAHDDVLFQTLPIFNDDPTADFNDWRERGYCRRSLWAFLNDLPQEGKPSAKLLVDGLRRDGKLITWSEENGFQDADAHAPRGPK